MVVLAFGVTVVLEMEGCEVVESLLADAFLGIGELFPA